MCNPLRIPAAVSFDLLVLRASRNCESVKPGSNFSRTRYMRQKVRGKIAEAIYKLEVI